MGAHEADAVRSLCASIGQSSAVVIVDRRIAAVFSQVIRGMCGVPVAWVAPDAPAPTVQAVLASIARSGTRACSAGLSPPQVGAYGGTPMLVMDLVTTQYPHELTQPPMDAPWPARYMIWLAVAWSRPNCRSCERCRADLPAGQVARKVEGPTRGGAAR